MKIVEDQLCDDGGTPVSYKRSVNQGRAGQEVLIKPSLLVMHFTAGNSLDSAVEWFGNPQAQASAHIVIGRDGQIVQCVKFNRRAWHAGAGTWRGRGDINSWSVGIEMVNWGKLKKAGGKWLTWTQREYRGHDNDPATDVLEAVHRNCPEEGILGWPTYTETQVTVAIDAAHAIARHYGITEVIGHEDFRPDKTDPGPAFPLGSLRARILGREDDAPAVIMTTTDVLNIRSGAGVAHGKVPGGPLGKGQTVQVDASDGEWRHVSATLASGAAISGWVHSGYLAPV
jgi:N-acetylmuramoyl-L-alanine amidase